MADVCFIYCIERHPFQSDKDNKLVVTLKVAANCCTPDDEYEPDIYIKS